MSETKTYVFPESGNNGGGGMMAMLAPLLQQKGIDPNLLVAMNSRNNSGFGGEGSWFIWVIFLFFLMGWGNNGRGKSRPLKELINYAFSESTSKQRVLCPS